MAEKITATPIGNVGMLGVLFVGLKLAGLIDWDWVAVLIPYYAMVVGSLLRYAHNEGLEKK